MFSGAGSVWTPVGKAMSTMKNINVGGSRGSSVVMSKSKKNN